jgi:hypothetical protein
MKRRSPSTTATLDSPRRTISQATLSWFAPGVTTGGSPSMTSATLSSSEAESRRSMGTIPLSTPSDTTATPSAQSKTESKRAVRTSLTSWSGRAVGTRAVA